MSTDERLARLGLLHLKSDPTALAAAMAKQDTAYDAKMQLWREKREKAKKAGANVPRPPAAQATPAPKRKVLPANSALPAPAPEPVPEAIVAQVGALFSASDAETFLAAYRTAQLESPVRAALDAALAKMAEQAATLDQVFERLSAAETKQTRKPVSPPKK